MTQRFTIEKDKQGQSQCYNCGTISWHSFMYKDNKYDEMLCDTCKELIEQGNPDTPIVWSGFIPRHREENTIRKEVK